MDMNEFRVSHYIRPNKSWSAPSQMAFVDCETVPAPHPEFPTRQVHSLRLGCASILRLEDGHVSRRAELTFRRAEQFWGWLLPRLTPERPTWLFAHGAGFDLTILDIWSRIEWGELKLADGDWPLHVVSDERPQGPPLWHGTLILDDPPVIVEVKSGDSVLICVDTRNYWPESLAVLGRSIGTPKLGWDAGSACLRPVDLADEEQRYERLPPWDVSDGIWEEYCRRDVEIIETAVVQLVQWWRAGQYGRWKATAPGLAWSAYRHGYMTEKIMSHGHLAATNLEREGYYGGEVRCYFAGDVLPADKRMVEWTNPPGGVRRNSIAGPVYHLDVNSLYPSVMRGNLYPVELIDYNPGPGSDEMLGRWHDIGVIAEVEIRSAVDTYPVRVDDQSGTWCQARVDRGTQTGAPDNYRTKYAVGRYWTVLSGPELERALRAGHVMSIGRSAYYRLADIFTEYVDHFLASKVAAVEAGDTVRAGFNKLLLNSLYGRFGLRANSWDDDAAMAAPRPWKHWYQGHGMSGIPQLWRSVGWHSQRYMRGGEGTDSVPAISAYVTSYAREYMHVLREVARPHNVLYMDTDSLHVTEDGYRLLNAAVRIHPTEPGKLKVLGVHESARYYGLKHYTLDAMEVIGSVPHRSKKTGEGAYRSTRFERITTIIGRRPDGTIQSWEEDRRVSLSHVDGTVEPSGWVRPIRIGPITQT